VGALGTSWLSPHLEGLFLDLQCVGVGVNIGLQCDGVGVNSSTRSWWICFWRVSMAKSLSNSMTCSALVNPALEGNANPSMNCSALEGEERDIAAGFQAASVAAPAVASPPSAPVASFVDPAAASPIKASGKMSIYGNN
jgi:hypothetical protein